MKKRKKICLFTISLALFLVGIFHIYTWYNTNQKITILNQKLQEKNGKTEKNNHNQNTLINPPHDVSDSYWLYTNTPFLEINFDKLIQENKDTVAWIEVMGTNIDYPVVQTNNNSYYLKHAFDNSISESGWIFSDFRNNLDALNQNTVFYGHGRLDGSMFGTLKNTLQETWYQQKENHIIRLSTPKENTIWQIISVYTIEQENYYITTHFTAENFNTFLKTIQKRSIHKFNTTLNVNDKILTLSTCQNNFGLRMVVHAKLIKKETREKQVSLNSLLPKSKQKTEAT